MAVRASGQPGEERPTIIRTWARWATRLTVVAALWSLDSRAGAAPPPRPSVDATPIAACDLQLVGARSLTARAPASAEVASVRSTTDVLANYEPSSSTDRQRDGDVDAGDPWIRLLIAGRRGPVVVDVAVFIDGQPFRAAREAWIDELMQQAAAEGGPEGGPSSDAVAPGGASAGEVVATPARGAPTNVERLRTYLAVAGPDVDRRETRWLIDQWGSGPLLLVLERSISWQRAREAPLWAWLDADGDGALSAAEIQGAENRLNIADKDRDDVVSLDELRRLANRPADPPYPLGSSLFTVLDAGTNWADVTSNLSKLYGVDAAERTPPRSLAAGRADATLRVDLTTDDDAEGGVYVISAKDEITHAAEGIAATAEAITMRLGGGEFEFSAAQPPSSSLAVPQVAVGAVVDGYPLTRRLDSDNDDRLTRRERRHVTALLASLDNDRDGQLMSDEFPITVRLAVTLGPHVHLLLSAPSAAAPGVEAPEEAAMPTPPQWFASMDRNSDGDVSRDEFLGAAEQFDLLDADNDSLVSIAEALEHGDVESGRSD